MPESESEYFLVSVIFLKEETTSVGLQLKISKLHFLCIAESLLINGHFLNKNQLIDAYRVDELFN